MKKTLALIILCILCLSIAASYAEGVKELTCQGIPWFSTPEEAGKILLDAGFIEKEISEKDISRDATIKNRIKKYGHPYMSSCIAEDPKDKKCPYTFTSETYLPITRKLECIVIRKLPKTIAKAKLSALSLYFTPDQENRQLVQAIITFKHLSSKKFPKEDIIEALEKAYGKPTEVKNKYLYIWLGDNNTIVIFNSRNQNVTFATLDGLALAESYDIEIPDSNETEPEDTGF